MKLMIIMRGLPGSGKSTLARKIQDEIKDSGHSVTIVSTDDYWMEDGEYKFDLTRLNEAHQWNLNRAEAAISYVNEYDCIIVDNTNLVWKDFKAYIELAITHGYDIMFAESQTDWKNDLDECHKKGIHNVPWSTMCNMNDKYKNLSNQRMIDHATQLMEKIGTIVDIVDFEYEHSQVYYLGF